MLTRRALLITGAAAVTITGLGAHQLIRSITPARAPWKAAAKGFGDPRLDVLAYAILAPNPHNMQPWQIRLTGTDSMVLTCNLDRVLPETDPPNRQIVIGLGAFLELLRQAAAEKGYRAEIAPFPEGQPEPILDQRPIAFIRLTEDDAVRPDPLFAETLKRRTSRVPFDEARAVPQDAFSALTASALTSGLTDGLTFAASGDREQVTRLKDISKRGWEIEITNPDTHHESTKVTRIGARAVNENPDGISLTGPVMEALRVTGILSKETMNDPTSTAFQETRKFYAGLIDAAPAYGWLISADNSRVTQLRSGAAWVRINQAATAQGLSMQPLSQVLQEFPAMAPLYREIHQVLEIAAPARIQGLFRFGYAKAPPPAPRWPLQSRLISA